MSWRLRVGTRPPTSTRASSTRRTTKPASRRSTRRASSPSNTASRCIRRPTSSRYRDYWGSRVHCFDLHQPTSELTVVGALAGGDRASATPSLDDTVSVGRDRRARSHRPVLRVPGRHPHDRVRRRHPAGGAASCGRRRRPRSRSPCWASGCARGSSTRPAPRACRTTAVEVLRAGRGAVCQDYTRTSGSRVAARGRRPGAVRVRLPLSRRARR